MDYNLNACRNIHAGRVASINQIVGSISDLHRGILILQEQIRHLLSFSLSGPCRHSFSKELTFPLMEGLSSTTVNEKTPTRLVG
jgi:hypothetical protein